MGKKTLSEVNYILRAFLQSSILFSDVKKPNGILSFDRLNSSIKEDVIIEPIAMDYKAANQDGVININAFVPNLAMPFKDTGIDKSQRNARRIAEIDKLILDAFTPADENDDAIYFDGYSFTYQQSNVYPDTENQCYINVRIEYNAITLN